MPIEKDFLSDPIHFVFKAVLDIFFCHDLYFLTEVGGEKRIENAVSVSAAEK